MGALLKILVVVLAVAAVLLWARVRAAEALARERREVRKRREATPVPMVACRWCGTYVPESAALQGRLGAYCCEQHRRKAER